MKKRVCVSVCISIRTNTHTCVSDTSVCTRLGYLWENTQQASSLGCLWEEGWELLFAVYLLYLSNFVPCTCIIYSKNKVFKF